jgi:Smr domain
MAQQFKVGERVRFLRERTEGVIQRVISASRVEVLVDDFVEMEVDAAEVVHIHVGERLLKAEDEASTAAPQFKSTGVEREPTFVVHKTQQRDYELWILNHANRELFFTCYQKVNGKFKGVNAAAMAPAERRKIARISSQEFHMINSLVVQVLQYPLGDRARPMPLVAIEVYCKTQVLNEKSSMVPDIGDEGWEFVLEEKPVAAIIEPNDPPVAPKSLLFGPEVVDLHIEKLVPTVMGIDSATMLKIQLEHFEKQITDAQAAKTKSLVFIHGTGSGKLRKELHAKLRNFRFVKSFEQADPLRYGNGATIVYF